MEKRRKFSVEKKAKIDTERVRAPSTLTVLTANGFSHSRLDGINVVPLSSLTIQTQSQIL
jgi:hypothetical protein